MQIYIARGGKNKLQKPANTDLSSYTNPHDKAKIAKSNLLSKFDFVWMNNRGQIHAYYGCVSIATRKLPFRSQLLSQFYLPRIEILPIDQISINITYPGCSNLLKKYNILILPFVVI